VKPRNHADLDFLSAGGMDASKNLVMTAESEEPGGLSFGGSKIGNSEKYSTVVEGQITDDAKYPSQA
jgi:hypothetical protein